jgi:hypothetical protein
MGVVQGSNEHPNAFSLLAWDKSSVAMPVHLMAAQALSVRLSGGGALVLSCQYSLGSHGFL